MASKAMAARLAANLSAQAGNTPAAPVDSTDAAGGIEGDESSSTDHITEGASAAEGAAVVPPKDGDAATVVDIHAKSKAAHAALLEEKLAHAREKRQSQRLAERAREDRKVAQADREAAKVERAKYDGLKTGSFKETLQALGHDPRKTFEAMQREAIEGSTPEGIAKREKEEEQRERAEFHAKLQARIDAVEAREREHAERSHAHTLTSSFQRAVADPAFEDLRIEYPYEALLDHAQHYDKNPDQLRAAAHEYGVRLTAPDKGFTMHELLQVLSAAQAAHNSGVQARRAAYRPAEQRSATPPTVNGTAPRRNAGTAIGNDLASERGSTKTADPALSPRERIRQRADEAIRRSGG